MRIGLASIHPRPLSGQIEGLVGLAHALRSRGHQVSVVSAFPSDVLLGADRMKLEGGARFAFLNHPWRVGRILAQLVRLSFHVDLIQLNLPTPAFSFMADLLQMLVRVPVLVYYEAHLVSVRDLLNLERLREAPEFYVPRLLINNLLVARLGLHRAARYLVSSKLQKAELVSLGIAPRQIQLLPNLIPFDKVARAPRDAIRKRLNLPAGRLITYVGHYNHIKGVDVLANAFAQLAARFDDVHLVLAWSGQGTSRSVDRLLSERSLKRRVTQLGRVNVPEVLAASDAVVLPYRLTIGQAVYPAVLLEAMAAGVPIVTSDLPLLRELTNQGETARLASPENPSAVAEAVTQILTEPDSVHKMLSAQQEWLRRNHPQCAVKDYERLYQQVTSAEGTVRQRARDCADVR